MYRQRIQAYEGDVASFQVEHGDVPVLAEEVHGEVELQHLLVELWLPQELQSLLDIHEVVGAVGGGARLDRHAIDELIIHRPDYSWCWLDVEDIEIGVHWFSDIKLILIHLVHLGCYLSALIF